LYGNDEWDRIVPGNYQRPPGKYTALEAEANEFSAAFLMPAKRFTETAKEISGENCYIPKKIAENFEACEDAVILRGKTLGLWE